MTISKPKPIPPTVIDIDLPLLLSLVGKVQRRVKYRLGAKAPSLDCDSTEINSIDCSGWVRYLIYRATHGKVTMPDGSWTQHEWCKRQGFKKCAYANAGLLDGRLRLAFINPTNVPGHVWIIHNGQTIESYGGRGPSRRCWNVRVLTRDVSDCYVLTSKLP